MGLKAGALLWNRMQIEVEPDTFGVASIDTGLRQPNQSFANYSVDEPSLGGVPSRVMVVPMLPLTPWASVEISEPYIGPNGNDYVDFDNTGDAPVTLNVMFWDPHSMIGPGDADPYHPII